MSETTRRGFVQGSAASLVAMGFTSSLTADDSSVSPNDKIQVGMVGAAGRAGALLRMFASRDDVDIVGIADIDGGFFHRYAMFTPASSIAGGSDEVLRNSIGERVLGLPREPDEHERKTLPWNQLRR